MIRNSDGSISSPCVNWCEMNLQTNYCLGCYRSIEEISGWVNFSEAEKERIWVSLPSRKIALSPNG